MSTPDDSFRRFGDREVGLILKRATELQDTASEPSGAGLTLKELEEIAAEAGIDPTHLRRAAAEVQAGGPSSGLATAFLGASPTVSLERMIPGEVSERVFELLVPEIQQVDTGQGVPSLFGRTLTWRSDTRSLQLAVSSRDGETQIRIEERLHGLAAGLFAGLLGGGGGGIGMGVGVGVGAGVLGSALLGIAFPLGVIGGCYLIARSIFGIAARRRQQALAALMDRLAGIVEREIPRNETADDPAPEALPPGDPQGT